MVQIVYLVIVLVLAPQIAASIAIISPEEGIVTTNNNVMVGWTDYSGSLSGYRVSIGPQDLSSAGMQEETKNPYASFNLEEGDYAVKVEVIDDGAVVNSSGVRTFSVRARPDFSISADLSEYDPHQVVIFRINAPLGSALQISVKGADDALVYNPPSLASTKFRSVLLPGEYRLSANLTYHDYRTSFTDQMTIGFPENIQVAEDQAEQIVQNATVMMRYAIDLTTRDSQGEPLPHVVFTYQDVYGDNSSPETWVTDDSGRRILELFAGEYYFVFSKPGFAEVTRSVSLDYENLSLAIEMEEEIGDEPILALNSEDQDIRITSPREGDRLKGPNVVIEAQTGQDSGFCVARYRAGSRWEEVKPGSAGDFLLEGLSPGRYSVLVRCVVDGLESDSEMISFEIIANTIDTSLISGFIEEIEQARAKMASFDPEIAKALKLISSLEEAKAEIEAMNREYDDLLKRGADGTSKRSEIEKRVIELKNALAKEVNLVDSGIQAVYLPVDGFNELFSGYLARSGADTEKNVIRQQKSFQEEFIVKKKVTIVEVIRMAGQKEEITLITEEISSPDQVMHDKAVIYIDDTLAYEGIEFIGDSIKVDKNYYEFGGEGITYMFRERIPVENARRIKTMVLLAEADLAKTPTGFSVSSIPREGNLLYAIVLVVLLTTIMGGYLMVRKDPSQKKLVSALAKDVEDALDLLDDGKEQKAFGLFPSILKKHSLLEKENQDQFTEMLVYLHGKLERHNFGMIIRNLEKEASFVGESMDDLVFDRFIGAFNMAAKKYNDLDDQVKTEFFGEIDRWYRLVKEMQEIR